MKITLVRTGGVAGMRRAVEIDTDDLDPEHARELERLVKAANLQRLSEPTLTSDRAPDRARPRTFAGRQERGSSPDVP